MGFFVGGAFLLAGGYMGVRSALGMFGPGFEERTYDTFASSLALAPDTSAARRVYSVAERRLFAAADADRTERRWNRWVGLATLVCYGGALTYVVADVKGDLSRLSPAPTAVFGATALFGAALTVDSFFPSTTERLAAVWRADPDLVTGRATSGVRWHPVFGVLSAGVHGTF